MTLSFLSSLIDINSHSHFSTLFLGGWGYVILTITVIVQCISHGLHMSSGILVSIIITRFRETLLTAGMFHIARSLLMTIKRILTLYELHLFSVLFRLHTNYRTNCFVIDSSQSGNIAGYNYILSTKIHTTARCDRWTNPYTWLLIHIICTAIFSSNVQLW